MRRKHAAFTLAVAGVCLRLFAQYAPTPVASYQPSGAELAQIQAKLDEVKRLTTSLHSQRPADPLVADVAVYSKAVEWALRYPEEFYKKEYVANSLRILDTGLSRAKRLAQGSAPWAEQKGRLIRGYRSRIDGSYQPYGLIIPESYDRGRPMRLDLVMHGRGRTLTEVSFIAAHESEHEISEGAFERATPAKPVPADQDFIQLDVFGRANNGYRWAAETDVFEALKSVQERYNIDPRKIVLRGFSMGGHGAWHIGLHYPDQWAAVEAGAGFTDTKTYGKQNNLTPWQDAAVHIYDSQDYALNAFDVPIVGYAGEVDPQLEGMLNIRQQLERDGFSFHVEPLRWTTPDLKLLFIIGPKTGHAFHPDSKQESDQYIRKAISLPRPADHIRFVTWTPRYNRCFWVQVDGLEKQYERAEVDAQRSQDGTDVIVKTTNVARITVEHGKAVTLDGQKFVSAARTFEKYGSQWRVASAGDGGKLTKRHGLQGPIDDFTLDSFICVRPTGAPLHAIANEYAKTVMDDFPKDFAKWFRGDVPVKDDTEITADDISRNHLVLFGDPGSNRILARIVGKLPIRWNKDSITLGNQKFGADDHIPVLIYPNPLNPEKYVVINSGHTFHAKDMEGTNALQYPRLGDYAVMKLARKANGALTSDVDTAGIFGEAWQLLTPSPARPEGKRAALRP